MSEFTELVQLQKAMLVELRRQNVGGLWSLEDVAAYLGLSYEHCRRDIVCKSAFPKPLMIGKTRRWQPKQVKNWVERQARKVAS